MESRNELGLLFLIPTIQSSTTRVRHTKIQQFAQPNLAFEILPLQHNNHFNSGRLPPRAGRAACVPGVVYERSGADVDK